jgi:hypothetical protein
VRRTEPGDPRPECVGEPLAVVGVAGALSDGLVLRRRNHAGIGNVSIRIACRLLAVHFWDVGPERFGPVLAALTDRKRDELARLLVHGDPDPWLVDLLRRTWLIMR